jgi:Ala-tRNA(Pro) deacylase
MAIARTVEQYLKSHDVDYELVEHPRSVTSMHTAQLAHVPGDQLAKSVLLEDERGYLVAVIPATHRLDLGKLHHQLDRRVGLAVEREVTELFRDCDPGAIPALGAAYRIDAIVDDALLHQTDVYFEAGDHEALVHVSGAAFGAMMAGIPHGRFTHHV